MGNLLEEILKSATSGDGSILGSIIKKNAANEESAQQTQPSSCQKDANSNFPKTGGKNDPFDIGDELDDIANGRNKGTATPSNEEEGFNIPSMEGINIGDILKKIVLGGSSIPFPTGSLNKIRKKLIYRILRIFHFHKCTTFAPLII